MPHDRTFHLNPKHRNWKARFGSRKILDESALLICGLYVSPSTLATKVEDFPGDRDVDREAIFQAIHRLKIPFLDTAAGFQGSKINFNLPSLAVVADDPLDVVDGVNRQRGDQDPLYGSFSFRWRWFLNEHDAVRSVSMLCRAQCLFQTVPKESPSTPKASNG